MNIKLAWCCIAAALVLGVVAVRFLPWSLPLLWPICALIWLAVGYARLGGRVWGKRGRGLRWTIMLPIRLALSLWHALSAKRGGDDDRGPAELVPGLWLGRRLSADEARRWLPHDVAVLDLSPEYDAGWAREQPAYLAIDVLEGATPSLADLVASQLFIDLNQRNGVFLCCSRGTSRSALVAAAWLLRRNSKVTVEGALEMLRSLRPEFKLRPRHRRLLEQFRQIYHD